MTLKKMLMIVAVIIATAAGCYYVCVDHTDNEAHSALRAWKKGEFAVAHRKLSQTWGDLPPPRRHLLRAYIHRDEGLLKASDQQLARALQVTGMRRNHDLVWEIHLNLALNAFLNGDLERGKEALSSAEHIQPEHSYTLLLQGMQAFLEGKYSEASALLSEPMVVEAPSEWLNNTIDRHLSSNWRHLALARCFIEEGEYVRARRLLEELHDKEGRALFALSHLREAMTKDLTTALQTCQAAAPYLSSPALAKDTMSLASRFTESHTEPHLFTQAVVFFSTYLPTEELAIQTARYILINRSSGLENTLPEGKFRTLVASKLEEALAQRIQEGREEILPLWDLVQRFSPDSKQAAARISEKLHQSLLANLNRHPDVAKQYITYWQELQADRSGYPKLSSDLIREAHALWVDPAKQQEGFELMVQAETLLAPSEQPAFRAQIASVLKRTYNRAKDHNDIELLSLVNRAARYFRIEALDPNHKSEVGNQIADATYFLSVGNFREAGKRAKWVVQLDSDNQEAHRILGLSYYAQGQYHAALMELAPLSTPDTQVQEITGICHLLVGNPTDGLTILQILTQTKTLADRSYLLMGYHFLSENDAKGGALWLDKIRHKDSEVCALLGRCAYLDERWETALDYFAQCDDAYAAHEGVKRLTALCHLALHQTDAARRVLDKQKSGENPRFSDLFERLFKD